MVKEVFQDRESHMKFKKLVFDTKGYYGIDLLVYQKPTESHKGVYVLVVIDFHTRYLGAYIQHDKDASTTLKTFKKIISKYFTVEGEESTARGGFPHTIYCDSGGEFKGEFKEYLEKEHDIYFHICKGDSLRDSSIHLENSITERVIRTLRASIRDLLDDWGDKYELNKQILDEAVVLYNVSKHRGIKAKPRDCFFGKQTPEVVLYHHNKVKTDENGKVIGKKIDFEVGDSVRISLQFDTMGENSKRKKLNSTEVYRIKQKDGNQYKLSGIDKWFKYTRLLESKNKPTPIKEKEKKAKAVLEVPELTQEEKEKKYRKQNASRGKRGDKALIAYNQTWSKSKNYELPTEKRIRKRTS